MYLCLAVLAFSCSDEPEFLKESNQNTTDASTERGGDGEDDLLGYGYNVTGDYADANSAGFAVINIKKLKLDVDEQDRYDFAFPYSQASEERYGTNAVEMTQKITNKVDIALTFPTFGGTLNSTNTTENKFDSSYIYASNDLVIKKKRLLVNWADYLRANFLTNAFKQDVIDKSPEQIVKDYGTHVITDFYTGGRFDVLCEAQTSNTNRTTASEVLLKANYLSVFNISTTTNVDATLDNKNSQRTMYYKTRGGGESFQMSGEINLDIKNAATTLNFTAWKNSVTPANSVMVDFSRNGLKPIYNFVIDPVKKAALKAYVDAYIVARRVTVFANPRALANGDFVKNVSNNQISIIFEGRSRLIQPSQMNSIFIPVAAFKQLTPLEIAAYPVGLPIATDSNLRKTPDGKIYLREGSVLRQFASVAVFNKYKFNNANIVALPNLTGFTVKAPIYK